jgi:hypothetical protein
MLETFIVAGDGGGVVMMDDGRWFGCRWYEEERMTIGDRKKEE